VKQLCHLRTIRSVRGMSQPALGYAAKSNQVYISEMERGLRPHSADVVARIAAVLDVSVEALWADAIVVTSNGRISPLSREQRTGDETV
jgi:transcriptional regulator with XRE-family HTH domain